jgi:CRP-like cAMP-binding protein
VVVVSGAVEVRVGDMVSRRGRQSHQLTRSALSGLQRATEVRAVEELHALLIAGAVFRRLVSRDSALASRVIKNLADRLSALRRELVSDMPSGQPVSLRSVPDRIPPDASTLDLEAPRSCAPAEDLPEEPEDSGPSCSW